MRLTMVFLVALAPQIIKCAACVYEAYEVKNKGGEIRCLFFAGFFFLYL
jgi:hypothetical protein